ncbi:uncharacterized protein LOC129945226 [Eupeodes corollae]|uniref:uncharacterized protein LOC129945226 n=1 Tax=Eupeodes corollae TaxID=290404 RepID=UPI0024924BA3|nr:uncharacterized protein LOC129945226 [Eupeodes corollae]
MRYAITARNRLAISLRYIGIGYSYRSLEFLTRVPRKTISRFMPELLGAIYDALHLSYLKTPLSQHEWLKVAQEFENIWDFLHTLGAIDDKHVRMNAPADSGSDFFNYKGFFSTVLLAVVDAHRKCIDIDVSGNGRNDGLIYKNSTLYQAV